MSNEQFVSDNHSGICPVGMEYLNKANEQGESPYGDDPWTQKAADAFRDLFETDCEVFFVFNGTAANSLTLASMCQSYHSVICHEMAHIETDECGGPEYASNGSKLLLGKGDNGKLTPDSIEYLVTKRSDLHYPKPKVISLTQSTELGTVYSIEELTAINQVAKQYSLHTHMDGARFANAVASLNVKPADITWKVGVDALCFSGTKNGLGIGEAILFFNKQLAEDFEWRCKQAGQLASKMRYISAPWYGLLQNNEWLNNARHANQCAQYLSKKLVEIPGVSLQYPVQANTMFVNFPAQVEAGLKNKGWQFNNFFGVGGSRLICSWATTQERMDELLDDVRRLSTG